MCTGYTHKNPNWKGTKQRLFTSQGVFFRKKIECAGDDGKKERPLDIAPADFLCSFVSRGNECRGVVELETYDKTTLLVKGGLKTGKTSLNRDSTVLRSNQPIHLKVLSLTLNLRQI